MTFFRAESLHQPLAVIGLSSPGLVDADPGSPTFGVITTTPKPGCAHTDIAGEVGRALGLPVCFDTDVHGAALAEGRWGAMQGLGTFIYLTIGTGLGGGCVVNGRPMDGLIHPQMGHIQVPHDWQVDPFPGACPCHGDCLDGLAAGPALEKRWGQWGETLPPDQPV